MIKLIDQMSDDCKGLKLQLPDPVDPCTSVKVLTNWAAAAFTENTDNLLMQSHRLNIYP